jgi:SprT protein
MALTEHPLQALTKFLPLGSFEKVVEYIHFYRIHLTVAKNRKSVLGDYRHPHQGNNHRISVNGNLNQFEFLVTFLHELAHLLTFEQYRNKVEPHGKEWKTCYSKLLVDFIKMNIFPADITNALSKTITNPAATANGETDLLMVLRKYDQQKKAGIQFLSALPEGALFMLNNGKIFRKGLLRRKRFACVELKTGLNYTISAIMEVRILEAGNGSEIKKAIAK